MKTNACVVCQKTKALNQCGSCDDTICKHCAQYVTDESFKYLTATPASVKHSVYCPVCFDHHVGPALQQYEEILARANEVLVFEKSHSKETRLVKRLELPLKIENESDRDVIVMKLAYIAAEKNYNSVIDVDITAKKVRDGSYQTTVYSATAIPANVSDNMLLKDRALRLYPN